MAHSESRETTPASAANKSRKGYAKERPPIPTKISLAYGAPGRVAMPQRLRPKDKNADVAEAIQEMLDEDQSAVQTSPVSGAQNQPKETPAEPSEDLAGQAGSEQDDEEQIEEDEEDSARDDIEDKDSDAEKEAHTNRLQSHLRTQAIPPGSTHASAESQERRDLGPQLRPRRSFATEARIAAEARIRRPAMPFRVRLRQLQAFLTDQWHRHNGQSYLDALILFTKVFAVTLAVVFSIQTLRPYLWSFSVSPLSHLRSPFGFGAGLASDSKIVFDNRPLSALQELTTHHYNSLRSRIDSLELSYDRLSRTINVPPPSRKVNFFALGSGVIIDPYLTSPTRYVKERTILSGALFWFMGLPPKPYPPPFMALTGWDDMGDCWCAPDSGGKSQLALTLQQKIVPQELVVEHIPLAATLDAGAAPRDIELWVQIADVERREAVAKAALYHHITSQKGDNQTQVFSTTRSLDATWVRIGRWEYNLFSPNHVQSFQIPVPLDHFDAPVHRLAIRTLSNWGKTVDYVCLYRLKLHGLLARDADMSEEQAA